ncbi:hypothetical protein SAMN02910456_00503 [Ruminococcaceae bacterium YRB3002]|nr:hypothetical protein SAMN02910456_00503 [Ruminococcaceae bacterium YRB3002]
MMEFSIFSIVMFVVGGALMLYAGVLALTKDTDLIMRSYAAKMPDKKRYALQFAKTIAIIAIAPLLSGVAGFFENVVVNSIVGVVSFVVCFIIAIKTFNPVKDGEDE